MTNEPIKIALDIGPSELTKVIRFLCTQHEVPSFVHEVLIDEFDDLSTRNFAYLSIFFDGYGLEVDFKKSDQVNQALLKVMALSLLKHIKDRDGNN